MIVITDYSNDEDISQHERLTIRAGHSNFMLQEKNGRLEIVGLGGRALVIHPGQSNVISIETRGYDRE